MAARGLEPRKSQEKLRVFLMPTHAEAFLCLRRPPHLVRDRRQNSAIVAASSVYGASNHSKVCNNLPGDGDEGVSDKRTKNSGVMIVAFAAVTAWQVYDMATTTETPSRALAILQYVLLFGLLLGLIGAVLNFLRSQ
jgi:hypothetical protein